MASLRVRPALAAFITSRVLIFALVILGAQIAFVQKVSSVWETHVTFDFKRVIPETTRIAMVGDAWSYRTIAATGYGPRAPSGAPHPTWAFFPLFPLAVRYLGITGDFALDGMLISNAAFAIALALLGFVANDQNTERAMFYLAFFPVSYFFSFPLPEALFLALVLGAFASAQRDRWWAAALIAALASATRVTGILLLPALLLVAVQHPPRLRRSLLWLAIAPAGLLAFMLHLHLQTGNALAFVEAQALWGRRPALFLTPLLSYVLDWRTMGTSWNLIAFNFAVTLLLLAAGVVLMARRQWAFGAFTLLVTVVALSSGSLQSMARYALGAFPMFLWLASVGGKPLADRIISAVSMLLLGWFVALLTLRVDFALA
jgi:hypothetical protein